MLRPLFRLANLAMGLALVALAATVLIPSGYNWDLDHEIYFGQRFLAGDLMWTREFHDKLPGLQVVFAPVAMSRSILTWQVMSLGVGLLAGLAVWRILPRLLAVEENTPLVRHAALLSGLLVPVSGGLVVWDWTSINPFSAGLGMVSALLLVNLVDGRPRPGWGLVGLALGAALAGALAISLRPYFIAPIGVSFVWALLVPGFVRPSAPVMTRLLRLLGAGISLTLIGVALNLGPYLVTGQSAAFLDGLTILGAELNPGRFLEGFTNGFGTLKGHFLIWAGFAGMAICALVGLVTGIARPAALFLLFVLVQVVTLAGFVATQHWWPHYHQLFAPYFALGVGAALLWLLQAVPLGRIGTYGAGVTAVLLALVCLFIQGNTARAKLSRPLPHYEANVLPVLAQALRDRQGVGEERPSFLVPQSMYLHWQLNESRHGFPHAANTGHIAAGWWHMAPQVDSFATPQDSAAYCDMLQGADIDVLVTLSDGRYRDGIDWASCLEDPQSAYHLDDTLPLPDSRGAVMRIYERS